MASTYTIRSVTSAETFNKLTVSCWFKGMADGTQRGIWGIYDNSDNNKFFGLYYSSNGSLYGYWKEQSSGYLFTLGTMQKFRDPNAWYHFVMTVDTTLATASDRVKYYLNGERITVFEDTLDTITQSKNIDILDDTNGRIQWGGNKISGTQYYWNGSMSHCHMCVGYAYDASAFGSTDSTTGEWKINTSPSVTYGTNGFFILKDGNSVTDQSGNSNNFTVGGGTLTKTEDCPSNVFATLNPLSTSPITGTSGFFSNGNTVYDAPEGSPYDISCGSTLGVKGGKWYWEVKWNIDGGGTTQALGLGIYEAEQPIDLFGNMRSASGYKNVIWDTRHDLYVNGSDTGTNYTASSGDILGFALDLDAGTLKIHQNGTYYNSGNAVTSAIDVSKTYLILASPNGGSGNHSTARFNFGNGYFGTTAVSSAGTNASGIGIFEYDVPANHTAISTKGLNL